MEYYEYEEAKLIELIKSGAIFIYPTDTVYGLGCNALLPDAVNKIKQIKNRDANKPMSIIAPSKQWIKDNLEAKQEILDKYLPGPYTLILKKKNKGFLSDVSPTEMLGVRIPNNDFAVLVSKAGVPFITTSINMSGEPPASRIESIPTSMLNKVDIILNGGVLPGTPSTIIKEDGTELKR